MMVCPIRNELTTKAETVLKKISELLQGQIVALAENDQNTLLKLDKELELAFGDKERTFGALRQHKTEHGC